MPITKLSSAVVQPKSNRLGRSKTHLSISDANKANWPPAGAVWFFEGNDSSDYQLHTALERVDLADDKDATSLADSLKEALSVTLDAYAPWTAHLRMLSYHPSAPSASIFFFNYKG